MTHAQQVRQAISAAIDLEAEWAHRRDAGYDDPACLPWMPFSWPAFVALVAEALPEVGGDRFLEVGCGPGSKMILADAIFGLSTRGVERVPEYVKAARQQGLIVTETDALAYDGYGDADLVFFNRAFADQEKELQLEATVYDKMKPGAVVIAVNVLAPPVSWYLVLDDNEVRRWIYQKPGA